jgi:hypothetical protein
MNRIILSAALIALGFGTLFWTMTGPLHAHSSAPVVVAPAPPAPASVSPGRRMATTLPQLPAVPTRPDSTAPGMGFWQSKLQVWKDAAVTRKPIVTEEIEAAGPRLHLTAADTEKLVRWNEIATDKSIEILSRPTSNEDEAKGVARAALELSRALDKAERRVLVGERIADYSRLRSAYEAGMFDKVDDHGMTPGPHDTDIKVSDYRPKDVDTSQFDPLFR